MRCPEVSNCYLNYLLKQPKFTHLFNKPIVNKYIINQLTPNQEQSITLNSFNSVASGCWIFLTDPDEYAMNNIFQVFSKPLPYSYKYGIDQVYLTNSTGINITNGLHYEKFYNRYLLQENFPLFPQFLKN